MDSVTQWKRMTNGVRVITEHLPHTRSAALSVLIDAGPQDEPDDQRGLAHLCEHAIFLGTPQRNGRELAQTMDAAGGCFGAFTAPDYTCVFAHVLEDYVSYAMDLIGDILVESTVQEELLQREKSVVCQEIRGSEDDPEEILLRLSKESLWPQDRLSRSVTGTTDDVQALHASDVHEFIQREYTPDRIIVAAAGAVDHQSIVEQVEDAFWNLGAAHPGRPDAAPVSPSPGRVNLRHMATSQCHFSLAIPTVTYADERRYALHVLNNLIGGGISSRLYQCLREGSGLVYSVHSTLLSYRRGGAILINGVTSPENLLRSIHLALGQLVTLAVGEQPIDAEELWKSKMQVRSQSRLASDIISNRVSIIATQEFHFGRRIPDDRILAEIDAVNMDDTHRAASEVLLPGLSGLSVSVVGPLSRDDSVLADLRDLRDSYAAIAE